jgi:hypothetical protein
MSSVEIWGYASMIVVIISMLQKNVEKLRVINTISCMMFVLYGVLIGAYPVILLNSAIIVINLYKLVK